MPVVCLKFCTFGVIALYFSLCKLVFFVRCQRTLNPGSGSMVMQHNSLKNNQHCHELFRPMPARVESWKWKHGYATQFFEK